MEAYAETFPHSVSMKESAGGQGPTYGGSTLDSSFARSAHSMTNNDSSTWKVDNLTSTFRNAHAKKPDPSSFLWKDAPTSSSGKPSVFSTSGARTSTTLSPYFLRSSGPDRAGDDVSCVHHDPAALDIDCFPGMESAAARISGQPQGGHHDGSRSRSQSPSIFSHYERANFDFEMPLTFQDSDNDTTEAQEDGE